MNGWCFLAGGSFVSLCFLPFVSVHSTTRHMSIAHIEEKCGVSRFIQAGCLEEWVLGIFWEMVVYSGIFGRWTRTSWVQQLPVLSSEGWFLSLSRPRHPLSRHNAALFLLPARSPSETCCCHGKQHKAQWIYSLTSCEQQVGMITAN